MEKLELKHIAPYLPYGLKARCDDETYRLAEKDRIGVIDYWDGEVEKISISPIDKNGYFLCNINECKPILRPMSDLYKPILPQNHIPIIELAKIAYANCYPFELENNKLKITNGGFYYFYWGENSFITIYRFDGVGRVVPNQLELFQYLFQHHFDVFGLIDKGIAIDINKLNK